MASPRFFVEVPLSPELVGSELALPEATAHHALRVRRLATGDALTLFDGNGGEYAAVITNAGRRDAQVRIERFADGIGEPARAVTLAQALVATDPMDAIVRHAVELGVAIVQPLVTARSARFPEGAAGDKRLAHWRAIAVSACEQCGRNRIPEVALPVELAPWLVRRESGRPGIVLAPAEGVPLGAGVSTSRARSDAHGLDVLVGPEGGFTFDEIAAAVQRGLVAAHMGPRILRAETAALAALAVIGSMEQGA